jgi:hypothetical protein
MESFKGQTPYEIQGDGQITHVKFIKTDPLPVVSVHINGGDEVNFLSIPAGRSSRSTQSLRKSWAFRNSARCKARFRAVNMLTLSNRA